MKKRIFASALAAVMALSLCACGGNAASSAAPSAGSAAPEETKAAQEINTPQRLRPTKKQAPPSLPPNTIPLNTPLRATTASL